MGDAQLQTLVRHLRRMADPGGTGGLSDAQLLERWVAQRDEAAFEVLVWRHGPMVLGLCRRLLPNPPDADDVFQATFLALVRRARSVRRRQALAGWLYRVALRAALRARAAAARRAARERSVGPVPAAPADDPTWRDLRPVLDEELGRLPERNRTAVILCYLQGKSADEAARQLGCPRGTVLSRLARARRRLRTALTRRGLAPSAGLVAAALSARAASAAAPRELVDITVRAVRLGVAPAAAAGIISSQAVTLTEGVLQAMFWTKLKIAAALVVALGVAAAGAVALDPWTLAAPPDGAPGIAQAQQPPDEGRTDDAPPAAAATRPDDAPQDKPRYRAQSQNNLKMLALAMHNYEAAYARFPTAASYDRDGKALLSWRVALLPFLEQAELYNEFKQDEPWNSPHNRKLLERMPKLYAPPGVTTRVPYSTFYQVFVGKGAGFEGKKGLRIADVVDGTSNTIMIAEAGSAVPWTKPEDLHYDPDGAIPELGGLFKDCFHAAFFDGSVRTLTKEFDEKVMRTLITRNGGEVVDVNQLEDTTARERRALEQRIREARSSEERRRIEAEAATLELRRENEQLRKELAGMKDRAALLLNALQAARRETQRWKAEAERLKQEKQ
jgi:RNA polymerase sigma factor (sigma-70 family)